MKHDHVLINYKSCVFGKSQRFKISNVVLNRVIASLVKQVQLEEDKLIFDALVSL